MTATQQRHVPLNSDSEMDAYEPARHSASAAPPAHVALNSASESEYEHPSAAAAANDAEADGSRGRGRAFNGAGFAQQTGTFAEPNSGDDDDAVPPLSDARARSRTPRGNRSKSRSRSRARAEGGLRTDVMMNSASEESSGSGVDDERVGRQAAGYVPQNEGSDTDADGGPQAKHINTTYAGKTSRSRSRSQNRAVRYAPPLNSESEADEVATEVTTGPPAAGSFTRLDRIDHPLNSESERE